MSQDRFRYNEKIHGPRVIDSKTGRWMSVDLVREMASVIPASPDPRDEVISKQSMPLVAEARIHAAEHPSKDIRYFAQCVVDELTERNEVIRLCEVALEESRDDVAEAYASLCQLAGYPANNRRIAEMKKQLARHDEALAAIKALERGK